MIFERIKALYQQGKITKAQVMVYVTKGVITREQAEEIIG